ncbi:hypothetical protein ACUNWD_13685 [Sunxiuqinia sp. A32]|uniref:hypothetical protein n=1 Tax=Sunxiuqinia sp. A32 TaxID=3461496 RepID=UPI00404683EE
MYTGLLHLHSGLRWLILLSLLVVLIKYFIGWFGQKRWNKSDNILGVVFTSLMDLQLLTGLVLYVFLSPITKMAFQDFGAAMKNPDLRFYLVEHLLIMILAVAFVHIGWSRSKKATTDRLKFSKTLFWFGFAALFILGGIPWDRI